MSRLRVVPIVEGHGEYSSVRILIERVWCEMLGGQYANVARPIREKRYRLVKADVLRKAVTLACLKLAQMPDPDDPSLVLVLVDADKDLPCILGPQLLQVAKQTRPDTDVTCVVANVEYETWFVAAADSLPEYLQVAPAEVVPSDPEARRLGKAWVQRRFQGPGIRYSETQDQPAMTARMDLALCRSRSPSFDKFCRELERRVRR